ncbi:MAG: hypothetical protein JF591_06055 [Lysobacter sp.]|nr:hypothetical protein [Lysobacter sp.]
MNRKPSAAVSTLLRWREFEEARASTVFLQRCYETRQALSRMQQAQDVLQAINARREELLAADSVDLVLLQAVDAFEAQAWSRLDTRRDEHAAARRQQDAAQDEHVAARARTRVAQTRHERLRAGERDQEEKLMFDRMADLYASHRSDRA